MTKSFINLLTHKLSNGPVESVENKAWGREGRAPPPLTTDHMKEGSALQQCTHMIQNAMHLYCCNMQINVPDVWLQVSFWINSNQRLKQLLDLITFE